MKYTKEKAVVYSSVIHWSRCFTDKPRLLTLSKRAALFINTVKINDSSTLHNSKHNKGIYSLREFIRS